MARYLLHQPVEHISGLPAPGSTITVYASATGSTLCDLYDASTGGTALANPYTVPATAWITLWVDSVPRPYIDSGLGVRVAQDLVSASTAVDVCRDFGAVGDGTTDDTARIQAAIDDVYARGSGLVMMPGGVSGSIRTFLTSATIVLKQGVRLVGDGLRRTAIKNNTGGAVVALQTDAASTLWGLELAHMTLFGKLTDTVAGDGVLCNETAYGVSQSSFHDLFITQCGRDGFHFQQSTNPYWAQYLTFERIFIGDSSLNVANGCQNYAFYASGGFSTNALRSVRTMANKKGIYIGTSGLIYPESTLLDTVNVQSTGSGDTVAHGIHLHNCINTTLTNCYIEGVSEGDSTHTSAALYIDGSNGRNHHIVGNLFAAFWIGIHAYEGFGGEVKDNSYLYNGTNSPSATPVFLQVGSTYGVYTLDIGHNQPFAGSSPVTRLSDPGGRAVGFTDDDEFMRQSRMLGLRTQKITSDSAAPTTGTWAVGDICFKFNPYNGGKMGWVCVAAGTPGTWIEFGQIDNYFVKHMSDVPTSGVYQQGDIIFNTAAAPSGKVGWVCTTAGTAGIDAVFKPFGVIDA